MIALLVEVDLVEPKDSYSATTPEFECYAEELVRQSPDEEGVPVSGEESGEH
jgi:hypothetical protein